MLKGVDNARLCVYCHRVAASVTGQKSAKVIAAGEALFTPKQAASRLQISLEQVYRLMAAGELAYSQVGPKTRRIPESAVIAFLRSHMVVSN